MDWKTLSDISQLDELKSVSFDKYVVIFKHSTTCPISSIAKMRLNDNWSKDSTQYQGYYLDLLAYRNISNSIAEVFGVHHESPQIIVIKNGEPVYDVSHLDISIPDIEEVLV